MLAMLMLTKRGYESKVCILKTVFSLHLKGRIHMAAK